jgi:hypothetical protein
MTLELKNTVINSVVLVKKFASVSPPLELTTKLRDVPAGIKMTKIDVQSTSLPPHFVQLARYKLEFLRRNPSYLKSYEKLQKTLIKKYSDWAPHDEMTPEEIDFFKKWKIGNVFAPGKSYDEWTDNETVGMCSDGTERKKKVRGFDFHRLLFNWLFPGFLYSWSILPTEPECLDDERIIKRKVHHTRHTSRDSRSPFSFADRTFQAFFLSTPLNEPARPSPFQANSQGTEPLGLPPSLSPKQSLHWCRLLSRKVWWWVGNKSTKAEGYRHSRRNRLRDR